MTEEKVTTVVREQSEAFRRLKRKVDSISLSTNLQTLSTGIVSFNYIIGGGLPEGRLTEIYGDFSSGKSVFVYQSIAEVQKAGGVAMLHDSEGALNEPWAEALGIDLERLFYYEPMTLEDVFQRIEEGIKAVRADDYFKDKPFLVAWDSVAATMAKDEGSERRKGEYTVEPIALRARIISAALRRLTGLVRDSRAIVLFVNQLRDRPMVMFGETEETSGGRAIKFHASLRLKMRKKGGKSGRILEGERQVGIRGDVECTKSKVCIPFRWSDFELYFDKGIPRMTGALNLLVREGRVQHTPKTVWYNMGERRFKADEFTEILWEEALRRGRESSESVSTSQVACPPENSEDVHSEES